MPAKKSDVIKIAIDSSTTQRISVYLKICQDQLIESGNKLKPFWLQSVIFGNKADENV